MVTITGRYDAGNDVLLVTGTTDRLHDEQGRPAAIQATGWLSAMEHHYPPDAYDDATGHRTEKAKARPMTPEERQQYAWELLFTVEQQIAPALRPLEN